MASGFLSGSGKCQTATCQHRSSVATYHIQEKQELCPECASSKDQVIMTQPAKDINWYCKKHDKPIEFVCGTHGVALCQACAFMSHQKPCDMLDLEDVIKAKRSTLECLLARVDDRRRVLRQKASRIGECVHEVDRHLKNVEGRIMTVFSEEMRRIDEGEQREGERIRSEAGEEIRRIEELRDTNLRQSHQEADTQRNMVNNKERGLIDELSDVKEKVARKMYAVETKLKAAAIAIDNAQRSLDRLLLSDKDLMLDAEQVETTVTQAFSTNISDDLVEFATRAAKKVHFAEESDAIDSRISGLGGSWELKESIAIPRSLGKPYFIGSIDPDQMVISDLSSRKLYVTKLSDKVTEKVLECTGDSTIISCMSFDEDVILCGNYRGVSTKNSFKGASLYNRKWELIMDIDVPKNITGKNTFASIHADKDGRVIAAEGCQSDIHIVNPHDGKVADTVKIADKKVLWIRALPSGDFVVKTGNGEFAITDSNGRQRTTFKNQEWDGCLCDIDPSSGMLFVVYRDVERGMYAVDLVTFDGKIEERKIIEYPFPSRKDVVLPCVVTSSRRLVTCNGDNFFVFQKCSLDDLELL